MALQPGTQLGAYRTLSFQGEEFGWQDPAPKQLNVVLNLFDELKRRVPTEKN
jgi:hypothetical protein